MPLPLTGAPTTEATAVPCSSSVVGGRGSACSARSCSAGRRTPRARGRRPSRSSSPARRARAAIQSVDADVRAPPLGRRERVGELAEEAACAARSVPIGRSGRDGAGEPAALEARQQALRGPARQAPERSDGAISSPPARRSAGMARARRGRGRARPACAGRPAALRSAAGVTGCPSARARPPERPMQQQGRRPRSARAAHGA